MAEKRGVKANERKIQVRVNDNIIESIRMIDPDFIDNSKNIRKVVSFITCGTSVMFNTYLLKAIKNGVKEGRLTRRSIRKMLREAG